MNVLCSSLALFAAFSPGWSITPADEDGDRVGYISIERSMELPSTLSVEGTFKFPFFQPRSLNAGKRITGIQGDDGKMMVVGWAVLPRPDLAHAYPSTTFVQPSMASVADRARMPDIAKVIEDLQLSWTREEASRERSEQQQAWLAAAFGCAGVPAGREYLQDMQATDADLPPRIVEIFRDEDAVPLVMQTVSEQYFDMLAACLFDEAVAMGKMTGDVTVGRSSMPGVSRKRVLIDVSFEYESSDPSGGDLALISRQEVSPLVTANLEGAWVWLRLSGYGDLITSSKKDGPISWRITCYAELSWNLTMRPSVWGSEKGCEQSVVGVYRGIVAVTGTDRTRS